MNRKQVTVTIFCNEFFVFNLIILKSKVPLMLHTKYQPNLLCHPGEKVNFIDFAIFSIGSHLGFSTRQNIIILKPVKSGHAACET